MYHRGGDRGWHHGHHQRDAFPPRNHQSAPYRGVYQDYREHNNYGQYDHNTCHERSYNDSQYMEYQEPLYHDFHEENRPYHDHRDPGDQGYHSRGHHDCGYQKDFRGGYHHSRVESGRYHNLSKSQRKKYTFKAFRTPVKESAARKKTSTVTPVQSVGQNPVRSIISGESQNRSENNIVPSQDSNRAQETAKPVQQDEKASQEDINRKPTQDETQLVQNGANITKYEANPTQVIAEPSEEDIEIISENKKPSEEDRGTNRAKQGLKVKLEHVDTITEIMNYHGELLSDTKPSTKELTTQLSCKTECTEDVKKAKLPVIKEEQNEFIITREETQEENLLGKIMHSHGENQFFSNKTIEIPLLGGWADMPPNSIEVDGASTARHPAPVVDYGLSRTAQELRRAFILAKKEEIELAFSQDCRTFAFVASTLLKKDPSLEVAVSNALRSTLQDIAGRCVQELSKFIDHYDNIPLNISERLQNSDI
ncbi:uncharacterized protein [Pyxicephalus adspersus]|uniref:Periphilin-1 C-terminal domain-containing protein n=1 Tax=Pyxicephalus adspersus TaxID=30357 RepID=A0AAV3AR24_PYXAD|nr:TPA: hypothetical protein GDO54_001505 [Pyxicephalus adspersus]